MTENAFLRCGVYFVILLALAVPLGAYMARVYNGEATLASHIVGPLERLFYRVSGVHPDEEMTFPRYAAAVLVFNLFGALTVYALQRLQSLLPLNPAQLGPVPSEVAFFSWRRRRSYRIRGMLSRVLEKAAKSRSSCSSHFWFVSFQRRSADCCPRSVLRAWIG